MQRFLLFAYLIFSAGALYAQGRTSPDSNLTVPYNELNPQMRPLVVVEQDENIFLCNWNTTQTFAYWGEKTDPAARHLITLVQPGQQFCMPIYGQLWSLFKKGHNGLDIHLVTGDSVRAVFDGKIRYAQYNNGGFGNLVIVRHANGLETYYAHFSKLLVQPGQDVKAGQVVGLGGTTGRSKGPHLHFEVRYHDRPLDPFSFIDYEKKMLKCYQLELNSTVYEPWNCNQPVTNIDSVNTQVKQTVMQEPPVKQTPPVTQTSTTPKSEAVYYSVKQGDTLYSISVRNKTTVGELCKLNQMKETDILSIGRKLRVR